MVVVRSGINRIYNATRRNNHLKKARDQKKQHSPLIIKHTIPHPQPPQKSPHVRIIPVDDGVYTFESGPAWICHVSVGEFGCFVSCRRLVDDGFGISLSCGADRGGDAPP